MSSTFGSRIKISIFGQSHGEKIGAVMDGLPAGEEIDMDQLCAFMARRAPGQRLSTARHETDLPHIVSGVVDSKTCGAPLCILIDNQDTRSGDYAQLKVIPRPGHADYPAQVRWGGDQDVRGGGHFSARLTAPLCALGGVLMQIYARKGIYIGAHLLSVHGIEDESFDPLCVCQADFEQVLSHDFPVISVAAGEKMQQEIASARAKGDSVGGMIECAAIGLPCGTGAPMFDGLENRISQAVFAIPAVKGIEFGEGFRASWLYGSENNDEYAVKDGRVTLLSNHAGGILGGLSSGAPLILKACFKPTPSIALPQRSVNLQTMENTELKITGRHDPCVALRAVACVEAATAIALADFLL